MIILNLYTFQKNSRFIIILSVLILYAPILRIAGPFNGVSFEKNDLYRLIWQVAELYYEVVPETLLFSTVGMKNTIMPDCRLYGVKMNSTVIFESKNDKLFTKSYRSIIK